VVSTLKSFFRFLLTAAAVAFTYQALMYWIAYDRLMLLPWELYSHAAQSNTHLFLLLSIIVFLGWSNLSDQKKLSEKKAREYELDALASNLWMKGKEPQDQAVAGQNREIASIVFDNKHTQDFYNLHVKQYMRYASEYEVQIIEMLFGIMTSIAQSLPSVSDICRNDIEYSSFKEEKASGIISYDIYRTFNLYDHTLRVVRLAIKMHLEEKEPKRSMPLTIIAALSHDIGKIPSIPDFNLHFSDEERRTLHHYKIGEIMVESIFPGYDHIDAVKTSVVHHHTGLGDLSLNKIVMKADKAARSEEKKLFLQQHANTQKQVSSTSEPEPEARKALNVAPEPDMSSNKDSEENTPQESALSEPGPSEPQKDESAVKESVQPEPKPSSVALEMEAMSALASSMGKPLSKSDPEDQVIDYSLSGSYDYASVEEGFRSNLLALMESRKDSDTPKVPKWMRYGDYVVVSMSFVTDSLRPLVAHESESDLSAHANGMVRYLGESGAVELIDFSRDFHLLTLSFTNKGTKHKYIGVPFKTTYFDRTPEDFLHLFKAVAYRYREAKLSPYGKKSA
jgi:HD superfamily phosphohydrolase YqeK